MAGQGEFSTVACYFKSTPSGNPVFYVEAFCPLNLYHVQTQALHALERWLHSPLFLVGHDPGKRRASCKKGVYRILAGFHFLQDRANFWQTDLFRHGKHRSVIVSVDLRFVLQK